MVSKSRMLQSHSNIFNLRAPIFVKIVTLSEPAHLVLTDLASHEVNIQFNHITVTN